jgi:phage terminase Nu1 subunit (DNA packaging protein)
VALVDVKKLSTMMNVTPRRVQQLATESGMPRERRGMYDAAKCLLWYIRYLQDALEKKAVPNGDGGYSAITGERARSLRADAELKEIELAEKRRTLVRIDHVKKCFVDLVHVTKAQIMATPYGIAQDVLGETSRVMVQAIVEKKLKEALNHLADDGSNYSPISPR